MPSRRISLEEALERSGLGGVHACRGLVEREQLRFRRERARDLEPALVAVGQMLGQAVGALGNADIVEQLVGALVDRRLLGARAGIARNCAPDAGVRTHVAADHHVLERGQVAEEPDVLERARDPARRDVVGLQIRQWIAVERELAAVWPIDAGQHIEQRRLARAVGTDQAVDLAVVDGERDVGQRLHATEALADARGRRAGSQRAHRTRMLGLAGVSSSRLRTADGRIPAGRNSIISTSARPKSSIRITSGSSSVRPKSASCTGVTV